jgi:hypothetical protein
VGHVWDLSKRTSLYSTVARIHNKNGGYVVESNPALPSPNTGKDSTGFEVGIRHRLLIEAGRTVGLRAGGHAHSRARCLESLA